MNRLRKFLSGGLVAFALIGAFALSGCAPSSGSDVASLEQGSASASPDGSGAGDTSQSKEADLVKFAGCMRDNGVDMPDPDPNASSFDIPGADKTTLDKAMKVCEEFLGTSTGGDPAAQLGDQVEFSKCMRKNGVSSYPDPDGEDLDTLPDDVDPQSPEFQKALKACSEDALRGAK